MSKASGIVLELQRECLDPKTPVSSILRKAKVIASKLGLEELKNWIEAELNGYDCPLNELPDHRKTTGQPKFHNPYHGWRPLMTDDSRFGEIVRTVWLRQSASEIENLISDQKSDTLIMYYNPAIQEAIQKQLPVRMECALHFSKVDAIAALDFVRNKMLDWTLELEQRGILGEGLSFGESEKAEAKVVTNHIYGSNIGVFGNVGGDANNSHFISSGEVDSLRLNAFLDQAIPASGGLDAATREQVQPLLDNLREETQGKSEPGRVTSLVKSLRTVLEGASGNLVASAILSLLVGHT